MALTELLAVILLASSRKAAWAGKIVLYMGDNQTVIRWLSKRQAKPPIACYLLQLLVAIEASYGFFLHSAYLRTYHNRVADALTRQDASQVLREEGLSLAEGVEEGFRLLLDRGWQRRALVWAGQAAADRAQALR